MTAARILVVEDERIVAMDIQRRLAGLGYEAVGVGSNGEQAIALAGELRPDLVLMDIQLDGEMDGIQAAEQIRQRFRLPVVFLTAYSEDTTLDRSKIAKPFGYILKPFQDRELKSTLEIALYKHQAEQTLEESQSLYHSLVENLPQCVFRKDLQGRFTFTNGPFCRLVGKSPAEIQGRTDADFFPPELAERYRRDDRRVMETGEPLDAIEENQAPNQEPRFVQVVKTPLRDANGNIIGLQCIFWDITKRKWAEDEIRRLNAELEERVINRTVALVAANEELESFSYSVSHDLRAPLRAINGFASILRQDHAAQLDSEGRRILEIIASEGRRMGLLVDSLLAFCRLGRQPLHRSHIDMRALAEAVFAELAAREPGRKLQVSWEPIPPAWGDPAMLRHVWVNLLANAIKYTSTKAVAQITIGSRTEGGEVTYFVQDNGVGFDMQYVGQLFGVFQRLHTAAEFDGMGVGLALTQRILRRHGGRVWADARLDIGATFFFKLPNESSV